MKYVPKASDTNHNVKKVHPVKELTKLTAIVLAGLFAVYILLGLMVDVLIVYIPEEAEYALGKPYMEAFKQSEKWEPAREHFQKIVDQLAANLEVPKQFELRIVQDKDLNAFAVPGNLIILLSGVIEQAESENEVTMVLGHELGHFVNKDHLRRIGRGLVLSFLSTIAFGNNSDTTRFVNSWLMSTNLSFSRKQESNADLIGIQLLNQHYGHVAGSVDFFERLSKKDLGIASFFSTHPLSQQRIKRLRDIAARNGWEIGEKNKAQFKNL